jgi:quercetin dioxygenase-like cupin family protein
VSGEPHIRNVRPDELEQVWRVHVASSSDLAMRRGRPGRRADEPVSTDARAGLARDPDGYLCAVEEGRIRGMVSPRGPSSIGEAAEELVPGFATRKDTSMNGTKGLVIPPGGGTHLDMSAPDRFSALKLLGRETNESVMLFEETVPAGTKSLFHLHHDSDEVAWVLAGEITFKIGDDVSVGGPGTCAFFPRDVPHAWKNTGRETARVLFLYTPAAADGYVEALLQRRGPMNDDERRELRERYRWEIVGPNPL